MTPEQLRKVIEETPSLVFAQQIWNCGILTIINELRLVELEVTYEEVSAAMLTKPVPQVENPVAGNMVIEGFGEAFGGGGVVMQASGKADGSSTVG